MNALPKVLIIDTDPGTRYEIETAMAGENYAILNAGSYEEALELISSECVTRIIMGSDASGDPEDFVLRVSKETRGRQAMICHLTDSEEAVTIFPRVTSELTQFTISRSADIHLLREKFRDLEMRKHENGQPGKVENLIEEVFDTLRDYNREMSDSIRYASKIQKAVLPGEHSLKRIAESFVLSAPRNIVSGDFFWFTVRFNRVIIAVADCTGHGVPGALLSIMGHDTLNTIVNERNISEPATILKHLNQRFQRIFENNEGGNHMIKDGMDVAVISIDPGTRKIDYAGARRPLIGIVNGELLKIKGDVSSIGIHSAISTEFTQHRFSFGPEDMLYLGSDGYVDQFGGAYNKKIGSRQFEQLIKEVYQLPAHQQKTHLEEFFLNWKKLNAQTDDVLVLGIKPGSLI